MLRRALLPFALCTAFIAASFVARAPSAWADTPADAGVTEVGSGSQTEAAAPAEQPKPVCKLGDKEIDCDQLADHPVEMSSTIMKLWKGGAILPAIIIALFVLLTVASKRIAWLTKDHYAAYTASGLAFLAMLVEPASRGTTPTLAMVMTAALSAITLFMNPKKPQKNAPDAATS
jgi:hypothetical protein